MATRIQIRQDTATNWTNRNPRLLQGEFGLETDTRLKKIGDGVTLWNALPYDGGTGTVTAVTATGPITSSLGSAPNISTSMATGKLIGRTTAGTGVMEEITPGEGIILSAGTIKARSVFYVPLTKGVGNDYTGTATGLSAYISNAVYFFTFDIVPAGAPFTANLNSLGAITFKKPNGSTNLPSSAVNVALVPYEFAYNGSNFVNETNVKIFESTGIPDGTTGQTLYYSATNTLSASSVLTNNGTDITIAGRLFVTTNGGGAYDSITLKNLNSSGYEYLVFQNSSGVEKFYAGYRQPSSRFDIVSDALFGLAVDSTGRTLIGVNVSSYTAPDSGYILSVDSRASISAVGIALRRFEGANGIPITWKFEDSTLLSSAMFDYAKISGEVVSNTAGAYTGRLVFSAAKGGALVSNQMVLDSTSLFLSPHGTSSGNTLELRFLELAAGGTNYVGFKASDAITSNVIWTLPVGDSTGTQALVSNGSGVLSWASFAGASGADTALSNLSGVSINTSLLAQTGVDLGSTVKPFRDLYLFGGGTYGTNYFQFTGTPTAARVITIPDIAAGTLVLTAGSQTIGTGKTFSAGFASNGLIDLQRNGIATTTTNGLTISNNTAATGGVPVQYSPALAFHGTGLNASSASQTADFKWELRPVNGTTPITANFVLSAQVAGAGYVDRFSINDTGTITVGIWGGTTIAVTAGGTGKNSVAANKMIVALTSNTYTETPWFDVAEQTMSTTVTFTAGTAPSGATTHTYRWFQVGNIVFVRINMVFATAGATVTGVLIPFPADLPAPVVPNGFTATIFAATSLIHN